MNQKQTGAFIAQCRKEQGLTQAALAERLSITDRAVSKWETGKCMPDLSIMPELCALLQINFNELLTGAHIDTEAYQKQAEENLMELKAEQLRSNKLLLATENLLIVLALGGVALLAAGAAAKVAPLWRGVMLAAGALLLGVSVVFGLLIEQRAGYYECPNCHEKHIPGLKAVVLAPHLGRSRRLTCPHCHKAGYHKKVLEK